MTRPSLKINLLKPTVYVINPSFNIPEFYILPHCAYVFYIYLRTNIEFCPIKHKPIGFCNRDKKGFLHGTNWVFKWSGLRFVFKGFKDEITGRKAGGFNERHYVCYYGEETET